MFYGEITGQVIDSAEFEQGMPLRPNTTYRKNNNANDNPILDLDLYNNKPIMNVSYNDPMVDDTNNILYSDVKKDNSVIGNVMPDQRLSIVINLFSFNFYVAFSEYHKSNNILMSPYTMLLMMAVLYRGSKGNTENNIKTFFSFPHKEETIKTIFGINKLLGKYRLYKNTNLVLFPKTAILNNAFVEYIQNICVIKNIDINNSTIHIINDMVGTYSSGLKKKMFNDNFVNKTSNIICISSSIYFFPWKYNFDYIGMETFNGIHIRKEKMMYLYGHSVPYYEDHNCQVIELDFCCDNNSDITMGIILSRPGWNINDNAYYYYINNMKNTQFDRIGIPKFNQEYKYKLDILFNKIGLTNIFYGADFSDIVLNYENNYVTDIIHHVMVIISDKGVETKKNNQNKSNNLFIANRPFMYYIRYKPLNILLFIGKYA